MNIKRNLFRCHICGYNLIEEE